MNYKINFILGIKSDGRMKVTEKNSTSWRKKLAQQIFYIYGKKDLVTPLIISPADKSYNSNNICIPKFGHVYNIMVSQLMVTVV